MFDNNLSGLISILQHLPSPMLSSKDRHMSSDMLQADERRSQFANDRKRHTSAPEAAGVSSE